MSAPSRRSTASAGWDCREPGEGVRISPSPTPFSRLRPGRRLASRNEMLARRFGDPTDDQRSEWLRRLDVYARDGGLAPPPPDRLVTRFAGRDRISVALLGNSGAGDAPSYAVVPVLDRVAGETDLAVLCGGVADPADGIRSYAERFYRPYADYPGPIYALPGRQDWCDGLTGFMTAFCDAPPDAGAPQAAATGTRLQRLLRRLLWRPAPKATVDDVADMRWYRDAESQQAGQPGPYCAIDAGPVRLVLIDTGISGHLDREQGRWLREVSAGDGPKILLTARSIYTGGYLRTSPIEDGGDVNEIVTDPGHHYLAVVAGDDHNYQRYPVRLHSGRTVQYVVAGGSGGLLSATHTIPDVDRLAPAVHEEGFRCYPLRGDSLARFSRRRGRPVISPDDAMTLVAEHIGRPPPRPGSETVTAGVRGGAARFLAGAPADPAPVSGVVPMFRTVLRLDASRDEIILSCWAATGCAEHEADPVLEDRARATPGPAGRWEWVSETPGRAVP